MIGDDNLILLTITAANRGEGAYETELHTLIPPEADYIGVKRSIEVNMHTHICLKINVSDAKGQSDGHTEN